MAAVTDRKLALELLDDPIKLSKLCWPDLYLYDKQVEILYSVRDNYITIVPAGNMLGKDFISALAVVLFFASRSPCKIVTSSVDVDQLETVLWGEMRRFIQTSRYPLPFQYNHLHIRQVRADGTFDPLSACIGRVAKKGEGMLGQHIARTADGRPRTLMVFDEASGIEDAHYNTAATWAQRILVIGNPFPCTNFFYRAVRKEGDIKRDDGTSYHQRIIRIKAEDSPNVRLAQQQLANGHTLTNETLIPGVIDYETYLFRRKYWDKIRQCISLDGDFYEGAEVLLYPPEWRNRAETIAAALADSGTRRTAKALGVDSAAGGDNTAWCVVDERGVVFLESMKTPQTADIPNRTIAAMRRFNIPAEEVCFDAGGGGQQHADYMRRLGHKVRTVAFGESATPNFRKITRFQSQDKYKAERDTKYVYKNRRAEMYGKLRLLLDPDETPQGFGIPAQYSELHRQMSPLPLLYDGEGRLYLPPKNKPKPDSDEVTITELIGCSPDELDALVLAIYGMQNRGPKRILQSY